MSICSSVHPSICPSAFLCSIEENYAPLRKNKSKDTPTAKNKLRTPLLPKFFAYYS